MNLTPMKEEVDAFFLSPGASPRRLKVESVRSFTFWVAVAFTVGVLGRSPKLT